MRVLIHLHLVYLITINSLVAEDMSNRARAIVSYNYSENCYIAFHSLLPSSLKHSYTLGPWLKGLDKVLRYKTFNNTTDGIVNSVH